MPFEFSFLVPLVLFLFILFCGIDLNPTTDQEEQERTRRKKNSVLDSLNPDYAMELFARELRE